MQRPSLFQSAPPTTLAKTIFRIALGLFLTYAGVSHLTFAREEFRAQVPNIIPISNDIIVIASGIVEILLGTSLIFLRRYRIPVGLVVGAFFVAVFPGNIAQYLNHANGFGLDTDTKRLIRLFFQPPLIAWALWSTGAWSWLRNRPQ